MLSIHQAIEIKESILAYLKATFTFQDKEVHQAFYDFVNHSKNGLFKGPYLNISLPFVKANQEEQESIPLDIKPAWLPYDHQVKSWHRLSSKDREPKPTIVTTGTGSGKTESFMFPILDYCYRNHQKQGIKVIILYPMNALATDQAKRFAQAIYDDDRTKGKITAGLFIGEGKGGKNFPKTMGAENIIENRESILQSPPDILLTNFKMLDYGLLKSNYNDLWLGNYKDTSLLKYLVLDELHTYDGAQGTDVANLIRRLKLKLDIPIGQMCPVGTSATIGSGEDAPFLLADYASKIFGEEVLPECIITENRLTVNDFFKNIESLEPFTPRIKVLKNVKPIPGEGYDNYINRQLSFWQLDKETLSMELLKLQIVKDLIDVIAKEQGNHILSRIIKHLSIQNQKFKEIPQWDEEYNFNPKEAIVLSLVSLISDAKIQDEATGRESPFLYLRTQLWVRELSGVLRTMSESPAFTWKSDIDQTKEALGLPPWFCRECGASGWLGVKHDNKDRFEKDINDVYQKFFNNHKHIFFVNRTSWHSQLNAIENGYETEPDNFINKFVYGRNLEFFEESDEGRVDVTAFRKLNDSGYNEHTCPECNTRNTVAIIGTRIATLSSVSVSQVMASDLDKQTEQKRKVLAFTNSVQDAAHQAGFVEARNYRFTFRSSLQKVINQQVEGISLEELSQKFITFWKENAHDSPQALDAYYYRFYPTDYLGKSSPQDYQDKNRYDDHFVKEFDLRVKWEVYSEFGYNALIGRTLEKTKSSGVHFLESTLGSLWDKMSLWLKENDTSQSINKQKFLSFSSLILHRMRTRGALSHEFLDKYRDNLHQNRSSSQWHLNWNRDSRHFLNKKFGYKSRLPKMITSIADSRGVVDSTFTTNRNWYHAYFKKSFELASVQQDFVNEFYSAFLKSALDIELLDYRNESELINYSINAKQLFVSNNMVQYDCTKCEHSLNLAESQMDLEKGKCLHYRCNGSYKKVTEVNDPLYYQLVYNRNLSPRIYAADHTGLLERSVREKVENDFKKRPKFNSKNVMVATSTLEMGIDIGDLNTAFNNSIPPLPSNYLQRIGRAGRSSGSALIINFAKSNKSHDLYYFGEPKDMMQGEVSTPGCYLEAKEILRRHFFAYCIDTWTKDSPKENHIPFNIKYLKLESTTLTSSDFFINRIINYIKANENGILQNFKRAYENDVADVIFDELNKELINESFYNSIRTIFKKIKDEIFYLKGLQKEITQRIKSLKLGKEDPERIELEREKKNIGGLIQGIRKRNTLEHLTNIGVLPNYAFPEKGVTLSAKVMGNQAEGSDKPPLNKDFELVRSASQAIKELAPDNYFYSQGFKFLITGVNTFDWTDKLNYHQKRFCSNCDHLALADTSMEPACPKCGDDSWSAASNIHQYAKLLSVKSFNNQSDATLNDGSDERELILYNSLQHFNFNDANSLGALAMKNIPFGIEFVKNVKLIVSNVGRQDVANARKVKINDTEYPAHGFVTCKHCGKSSSNFTQRDYKFHYGYCKHKDSDYTGTPDDVFDEVFFYRELNTEVLKVLLPVQDLNGDAEVKMFRAGLELGLKKYFKGNPQHISFCDYNEYNQKTSKFDRYLLLYDSIPGGTGYLQDMFKTESFSKLIKEAYLAIKNCSCQHEGKDGCYRCIYSYSNQYYQDELSRAVSEKRFEKIFKQTEDWESYPSGLGNITNTGHIEESELEERFIRSIKNYSIKTESLKFEEVNDDGTISYVLSFNDSQKSIVFHIRPQLSLGNTEGISLHSRPDFTFICTKFEVDGIRIEDIYSIPRIAMFLDGFQYHASTENNIFQKDVAKRDAISMAPNYLVWTLTWKDIEIFDGHLSRANNLQIDYLENRLNSPAFLKSKSALLKATRRDFVILNTFESNLHRFLSVLFCLNDMQNIRESISLYLGFFQTKLFQPSYPPQSISESFADIGFDNYCLREKTLDGLIVSELVNDDNSLVDLKTIVNIDKAAVHFDSTLKTIEVIDKEEWNVFWSIYNLLQFGENTNDKSDILPSTSTYEIPLEELIEFYKSDFHKIITSLFEQGFIQTEDDETKLTTLIDEQGSALAQAEFIYKDEYVVEPSSQKCKLIFEKHGFNILSIADFKKIDK